MKNKFSSLCIVASLLLGSQGANAAYYYYGPGVPTCSSAVAYPQFHCRPTARPVKHYYHRCHRKYHRASHVRRSHYSIEVYYYVPAFPCSCYRAVYPSPCGCSGAWMRVQGYPEFSYGPYREGYSSYYSEDDMGFDMDMRTGDDVRD